MPDTPFKSMTPDPTSRKRATESMVLWGGSPKNSVLITGIGVDLGESVICGRCGATYYAGDWPWCRGAGYAGDHDR